jgi:3-oxoacyl-[acyl-carrier-protein] synthase II
VRRHRVVITGLGVVSSIGIGARAFCEALRSGKSGITEITSFDTRGFPFRRAGEIREFDHRHWVRRLDPASIGKTSQLAIAASRLALEDARIDPADAEGSRCGVSVGTTDGETLLIERFNEDWVRHGLEGFRGRYMAEAPAGRIAVNVARDLGLEGEVNTFATACAAGNYAIGHAYDLVSTGEAPFMLCGGADSLSRKTFAGFFRLNAIAPLVCQPFDRNRQGLLTGEGAGMLLVERREDALLRRARIYAEILGYGLSCDGVHMTAPDRDSIATAMRRAIHQAGLRPADVSYVCAHGTGTRLNDLTEAAAIHQVFEGSPPPVSSVKSMIGHTRGAASAIAASACALAIYEGFLPPTINSVEPDPECALDCVPNRARDAEVNVAQNNAFAFGGNNAILMLGREEWTTHRL